MASAHVRDATPDDLPPIAAVAVAAGQDHEWSGADAARTALLAALTDESWRVKRWPPR